MKADVSVNNKKLNKSLACVKDNILSISELKESSKLSEILNIYTGPISDRFFVIKNNNVKDAVGILLDYERFAYLLKIEEIMEEAIDNHMIKTVYSRKDIIEHEEPVPLREVVQDDDFDFNTLQTNMDLIELEEE